MIGLPKVNYHLYSFVLTWDLKKLKVPTTSTFQRTDKPTDKSILEVVLSRIISSNCFATAFGQKNWKMWNYISKHFVSPNHNNLCPNKTLNLVRTALGFKCVKCLTFLLNSHGICKGTVVWLISFTIWYNFFRTYQEKLYFCT